VILAAGGCLKRYLPALNRQKICILYRYNVNKKMERAEGKQQVTPMAKKGNTPHFLEEFCIKTGVFWLK